jgi:2-keto-4-pentenoate hydratase/2-oxohepta-3-ene-1,7-dioic acid hydratase in catechol pathway
MKLVRFRSPDGPRAGVLAADGIRELGDDFFAPAVPTGRVFDPTAVTFLAPLVPGKFIGIGRNYAEHAQEMGGPPPPWPDVFLKPPSSAIGPDEAIELPAASARVEIEGELGVVVGRRLRDATPAEAAAAIFGLTIVNDVTARDLQRSDRTWARAKGFDTFGPLGPCVAVGLDPRDLALESRINGQVRQRARTSQMLHPAADLLAYVSRVMTLLPGDVLATGTPAGVWPIVPGDVVEIEIEGIGILRNPVVTRPARSA